MQVSMITPQHYNNNNQNGNINFKGKDPSKLFKPLEKITKPISGLYDQFTDELADSFIALLETKPIKKIIEKTGNSKHLRTYQYQHLTACTGLLLSGLYVKKTLDNKNLDEKKKRTLAINQGLVTVLSTASAYFVDNKIGDRYQKFANKILKNVVADAKTIEKYKTALSFLKSTVVFAMIYRFLAPVFVTPIANKIGNKLEEKEALKAKSRKTD